MEDPSYMPGKAGDMLKSSIEEEAAQSFGQKVVGACCGSNLRTFWWRP